MDKKARSNLPLQIIERRIYLIRRQRVMLDSDLAELYGVTTKQLNQQVRRNAKRFPSDFMFELVPQEAEVLRSQFVTSNRGRGGRRYLPLAFTEQGVAMLSSVLNSNRAILVNIAIMRTFVKLREMLATNGQLREKLEKMEQKYDGQFRIVFEVIQKLLTSPGLPRKPFGFEPKKERRH